MIQQLSLSLWVHGGVHFGLWEATLSCISEYSMSPTYEPLNFELPKISTCVPSVSGVTDIAACPPSLTADDPSALPSPTSYPSPVHNSSCLFTRWQPLCASCWTILLYFSRYCTVRLKMFPLFFVLFIYYLCEKYYKPITV